MEHGKFVQMLDVPASMSRVDFGGKHSPNSIQMDFVSFILCLHSCVPQCAAIDKGDRKSVV